MHVHAHVHVDHDGIPRDIYSNTFSFPLSAKAKTAKARLTRLIYFIAGACVYVSPSDALSTLECGAHATASISGVRRSPSSPHAAPAAQISSRRAAAPRCPSLAARLSSRNATVSGGASPSGSGDGHPCSQPRSSNLARSKLARAATVGPPQQPPPSPAAAAASASASAAASASASAAASSRAPPPLPSSCEQVPAPSSEVAPTVSSTASSVSSVSSVSSETSGSSRHRQAIARRSHIAARRGLASRPG